MNLSDYFRVDLYHMQPAGTYFMHEIREISGVRFMREISLDKCEDN